MIASASRSGSATHSAVRVFVVAARRRTRRGLLGLWFQAAEGAKFWLAVLTELKQRGVQDVLVCCVDGLKGFLEAIEAVPVHHQRAKELEDHLQPKRSPVLSFKIHFGDRLP